MSDEQRCGLCAWFDADMGLCDYVLPVYVISALPAAYRVAHPSMDDEGGTNCPTFKRKELGK